MKPKGRHVQALDLLRGLQGEENLLDLPDMIGIHAFRKVVLEQLPQPLMPKTPNHPRSLTFSVTCLFPRVNR
jgi:hypothetical protein